jgi:thiamine pyrophosphate-dependent acetolactate synthase large subunit-like protein
MKVHEAIAKALVDNGVDTMFGLIGDANLFMVDRFVKDHPTKFVAVANEANAVLGALGYAGFTGRVGVATVTHGPALTNTVTALVEGVKGRMPIVVVAGDTPVIDKYNFQNAPQRDIVVATGAGFEQVRTAATTVDDVVFALRRAEAERRPIVLNMPIEQQWEEVEYQRSSLARLEQQAVHPDPAALDRAVGIIASARRPIVLAGRGASNPETRASLLRLADRIGAPVATTLKGKDLFRGERFNLDIFGTLSHEVAIETIMAADCVIAFGAGLNKWTAAEGAYLADKRVVHCDIDPANVGYYSSVDAGVVGDAKVVADAFVEWLDEAEVDATGFTDDALAARLADFEYAPYEDLSTETTVDLKTAILAIERAVPADRNLVLDAGRFVFDAFTMFHAPDPQSFMITVNYGSIGLGLGHALGAAMARRDRPTLLIAGDGGFMLGCLVDFNTAVRQKMDMIVVVLNDDSYGAEHIQFITRDMDPSLSLHGWPDFAPVAEALGGSGYTVRNVKDLDGLPDVIAGRDRPLLIDVKIDPNHVTRPGGLGAH